MELKEGYKQTEIGVIPKDWDLESVGRHFEFKNGLNKAKEFFGHGSPIVNYMDVFSFPGLLRENVKGLVSLTSDEKRNYSAKKGDVFFTRTSETLEEVGMSSVLLEDIDDASFSGFVLRARQKGDRFAKQFCQFCFRTEEVRKQITSKASYTTRALTNGRALSAVKVPLPPTKAEQEAIAEALSDADALIESLEQLIAKKRQIKQGAMQELLTGKKRLPGFGREWEVKTLGQLGKCYRGVSYSPSDLSTHDTSSTVRLLRSNNVQHSSIVFSDMQYVEAARVSEHQNLRNKDVLICMANGSRQLVGKAGQFFSSDGYEYTFGAFMGAFRPDPVEADSDYVFMLFSTEAYRHHIDLLLAGSSINNLTPSSVEELQLLMPQPDEQTAIATILSDMDAEIAALETKLAKARQVKQGMMQELLTGNIRLVQPEKAHA